MIIILNVRSLSLYLKLWEPEWIWLLPLLSLTMTGGGILPKRNKPLTVITVLDKTCKILVPSQKEKIHAHSFAMESWFCFGTWITNSIHIHIREKFWASSILNLIHIPCACIPCAFTRTLHCNRYEYTYVINSLGWWFWIQYEYINVKESLGIRNVYIPARMVFLCLYVCFFCWFVFFGALGLFSTCVRNLRRLASKGANSSQQTRWAGGGLVCQLGEIRSEVVAWEVCSESRADFFVHLLEIEWEAMLELSIVDVLWRIRRQKMQSDRSYLLKSLRIRFWGEVTIVAYWLTLSTG